MIKKDVYTIPDKFTAVQYDGTTDVELAQWCKGAYRPSEINEGEWDLYFGFHDAVSKGNWVVQNYEGIFYGVHDDKFKEEYVEKVSYENQSS